MRCIYLSSLYSLKKGFRIFNAILVLVLIVFAFITLHSSVSIDPSIILFVTLLSIGFSLVDFSPYKKLSILLTITTIVVSTLCSYLVAVGTYDVTNVSNFINSLTLIGAAFLIASLSVKNYKIDKAQKNHAN